MLMPTCLLMPAHAQLQLRPYPLKSTGTRPNSEVKPMRAYPSTEMRNLSGTVSAVIFVARRTVLLFEANINR